MPLQTDTTNVIFTSPVSYTPTSAQRLPFFVKNEARYRIFCLRQRDPPEATWLDAASQLAA